jgi:hypothetical protein
MTDPNSLDLLPDATLLAFARKRIAADLAELAIQGMKAGLLEADQVMMQGVNTELGFVCLQDEETGAIYALGPADTMIVHTADGQEGLFHDGEKIYVVNAPGALQ